MMSQKLREESAKLFNATSLLQTKESEHCPSGKESKVGPDQWVCIWLPEDVEIHRNLTCDSYAQCLENAVQRGWDGFTCNECPNFLKKGGDKEDA
jgi:hypothetical protein